MASGAVVKAAAGVSVAAAVAAAAAAAAGVAGAGAAAGVAGAGPAPFSLDEAFTCCCPLDTAAAFALIVLGVDKSCPSGPSSSTRSGRSSVSLSGKKERK
jgi:hypothetical protein